MQRSFFILVLCVTFLVPTASPTSVQAAPAEPLCFQLPGVVDCIDPHFRAYWEANGGLPVFGYPLTPALPEQTADGLWLTQQFERNRLEWHPDAQAPYTVQLGRLGADRLGQLGRDWYAEPRVESQAGCRFFTETGHNLCEPFLKAWRSYGLDLGDPGVSDREALALWGLPLTEPQRERNSSGDEVMTQWFERGRFEDHGAAGVLLGRLGAEVTTVPAPPAAWVTIAGDRLLQAGQPLRLKGVNYYPAIHPWAFMWKHWDGPVVERDLRRMRRELGANVVRVLVPFQEGHGWSTKDGTVPPQMLNRLAQFVQLAGENQIKVIITLFDWHGMGIPKDWPKEQRYLESIITAFRDDDRVLAWDLHNEPDNYPDWSDSPEGVVTWLTKVADVVHAWDTRHPVTVGVGKAPTLWVPGEDGRTILDVSDLVSVHGYDAASYETMLREVRSRTGKPILLEEFGWPSGPTCVMQFHDEASQLYLFRQVDRALQLPGVVGGLSWWFEDSPVSPWNPIEVPEMFFGLYRRDGSSKPALGVLRSWRVPALASERKTSLALTVAPVPSVPEPHTPIWYGDLMLNGSFKHFWQFFGGEATFGPPISQPYRQADGKLVQYFARARFELNESEHVQPIDPEWPEGQKPEIYLDRVHLTPLGQQLTAGREFVPVPDPGSPEVLFFPATGHTVRGAFRKLWQSQGELFFGAPISEELVETIDGEERTVQYFEKWRMERLPDGSVRLGDLGRAALVQRPCVRGW